MSMAGKLLFLIFFMSIQAFSQVSNKAFMHDTAFCSPPMIPHIDESRHPSLPQDFDYSFHTFHTHLDWWAVSKGSKTSIDILLPRLIEKKGDKLTVTSLNDPTNIQTYTVKYFGSIPDRPTDLIYFTPDKIIVVRPLYRVIIIGNEEYY